MRRRLMSLGLVAFLGLGTAAFAQVTGVVNDANGFPESDAEVIVKGTGKVAITDENGNFDIDAKVGDVLVINGKEFKVSSTQLGVLKFQDEVALGEVIVTAYGVQTKESLTGSVGEVKAKEIANITSSNVVQGMTGKVAGVQIISNNGLPGTEPTVRFRGIGSINGSSSPLYVVDGVAFNGNVAAINNQDIESMTFLKDASAAALYGSRGANGVIIITTKKGKKGTTNYTLDLKTGVASRGVQEYKRINDPLNYYEAYHSVLKNTYVSANKMTHEAAGIAASDNLINGSTGLGYNITNVANNVLVDPVTGKINPNASVLYQENWDDFMYKDGFFTNTYFSASGADDKTAYYFSGGYEKNDSYVVNSGFEKITARMKLDHKISDRIKVGGNMSYTNMTMRPILGFSGTAEIANPFYWNRFIAPIYPVHLYDNNGKVVYDDLGNKVYDDGRENGRPFNPKLNPYATSTYNVRKDKFDQVFTNGYASLNIFDGLDFTYSITGELSNVVRNRMQTPIIGDAESYNGTVSAESQKTFAFTQQQMLTYKKRFGSHNFEVLLGHETLDRQVDNIYAARQNLLIPNSQWVNHAGLLVDGQGYGTPYALEGYLARVNYDYANKYFVNANFRRDGSSRFHPDNRWGNFYGVGAAWRVSQEDFLKGSTWLSEFKLKGSYGEQGNDNLGYNMPYLDLYEVIPTTSGSDIAFNQVFQGNKDVTWEKNANLNAGVDLGLFNNRLTIEAEYFHRKSLDMLYMKPLAPSGGFSSRPENIGDMKNEGFEVTLGVDIIRNADLRLSFSANATKVTNTITALPEDKIVSGTRLLRVGGSVYNWYLKEFAGVNAETGAAQFVRIDPVSGERSVVEQYSNATFQEIDKKGYAPYYGGFSFNFEWKGFDLSANFAFQAGGYGYDSEYMSLFGGRTGYAISADYNKTWTINNKDAKLPVLLSDNTSFNYSTSTLGLIKSDYLSLENVSIGYTFGENMLADLGIKSLRFYVLGDKLFVWSKRKGYDPRTDLRGISGSTYSMVRTISAGINFSF